MSTGCVHEQPASASSALAVTSGKYFDEGAPTNTSYGDQPSYFILMNQLVSGSGCWETSMETSGVMMLDSSSTPVWV